MPPDASAAVDSLYRSDWGRIVATLIRLVGDFDVAEDAAQEAFAAATGQWGASGVPEFPRAWIIQTARHKAIDRIRRRTRFAETREQLGGFMLIDVRDLDEAIGIAARIPLARTSTVEVRPVRDGVPR